MILVEISSARYLQYKAILTTTDVSHTPYLEWVNISYSVSSTAIITLQGKLTDTNGNAVSTASIRVNISDIVTGVLKWNKTFNDVVDNGVFNLALGSNTALDLTRSKNYSITIEVDLDSATFSTTDIVFGDVVPSNDVIKFALGEQETTELPTTIVTLQGKMTDTNGKAVSTASFRINISKDSTGVVQWNKTFNNIVDTDGVFNIGLGAILPMHLDRGELHSIVVEVDRDSATFSTADIIYGDGTPSDDNIKFIP